MKICLVRPSKLLVLGGIGTGAATSSSPYPTAPLGIALIAGTLRNAGHSVTVIDAIAEAPGQINELSFHINSDNVPQNRKIVTTGLSPDEMLARIPKDTEVLGISCMFTHNWIADRQLLNYFAKHIRKEVVFIAGGESITGMADICLKQVERLSVCVLGEGEETILDLLDALEQGRDLRKVNGIAYKENGEVVKTEKRTRIKNVDEVPFAAWDMFPYENYERHALNQSETPRLTLPIMATRGCPYQCTFCTSPDMWGTRYYMRSPENVLAEMQQMKSQMGITNFEFYDLTAIIQKKWIMDFAQLLIDSKMNISWRIPSGTRTEVLDSEVAEKLRESGCFNLTYAPESGSNRMLKLIKKKVVLSRMLSSMKQSHRAGLNVYMNMILGLPDEKHTDVWKTLWFVARCAYIGVHDIALGIFRPYPGSALFNRLVQEKKIDLEKDDFLVEIIMAIETEKSSYNDHVSTFWYEVYKPLTLSVFYGVKYITSPSKFFQAIVNIARGTHGSRMERSVLYLIRKAKNNILDKIAIRKPVSVKNVS